MSANRVMFAKFWKSIPDPNKALFGHSRGFDFAKPVNKVVLKAGTEACQWQVPGDDKGMQFAACGSRPTRLGIADRASRTEGGDRRFLVHPDNLQAFQPD